MRISHFLAAILITFSPAAWAQSSMVAPGDTLPRQALLEFRAEDEGGKLVVRQLAVGSPAAGAGLAEGDVLTTVNGKRFSKPFEGQALLQKLDGGVAITLAFTRAGATKGASFTAKPRPLEAIPGVHSIYGSVITSDGARLRTIISKPEGAKGRLHPVIFMQWVSCGSIEYRPGSESREILATIARSTGLALVRVERSSDGDSDGPSCHELDYDTEVAHYVEAYKLLLKSPELGARKVFVNGSSLGSTTAPLVALEMQRAGYDIAGIAVQGGGAETYYERMLTFDRHYLERRPEAVKPAAIHGEMIARARFHYEYLIRNRMPDEIAKDGPEMAAVRRDIRGLGDGEHYGRPYTWHQQAAKRNFLAAWAELDAPALVIYNAYDQYEAQYGANVIVNTVNRLRPGSAKLLIQDKLDHGSDRYASALDAYAERNPQPAWQQTAAAITEWLKKAAK